MGGLPFHEIIADLPEWRQPLPAGSQRAAPRDAVALAFRQQIHFDALEPKFD